MLNSKEFEDWLRFTVPWQLNLSPSKRVAMKKKFYSFADLVRPLEKKAPAEFEQFFKALQIKVQEVNTWRAPRGTRVSVSVTDGKMEMHKNGTPMYDLIEKDKKEK